MQGDPLVYRRLSELERAVRDLMEENRKLRRAVDRAALGSGIGGGSDSAAVHGIGFATNTSGDLTPGELRSLDIYDGYGIDREVDRPIYNPTFMPAMPGSSVLVLGRSFGVWTSIGYVCPSGA